MYINCRFNRIADLRTASCPNLAMIDAAGTVETTNHNPMPNTGYLCVLTSLTDSLSDRLSDRMGEHTFFAIPAWSYRRKVVNLHYKA